MAEPLPDHYKALGVEKSATSAQIKATYRKKVLTCHPDKVTDPALKEQKQEEFHKIQQAYEVLVDDDKRADYEAHLTIEALRKENAARRAANASAEKSARFDVPTRGGATMRANGPTRYATEERKPSRAYDEDDKYYDERSRSKYDTYAAYPSAKSGASPPSKRTEKESYAKPAATRPSSDRTRSDRNKTSDRERRREHKFVSVEEESSDDGRVQYEEGFKRRSQEDEMRRQAADTRRKTEDRRSYEDPRYDASPSARKLSVQEENALRYQHKSRSQVEAEIRPQPVRTSSRDYFYGESSRSSRKESARPENVRRSSAARISKERTSSGRDRDRGIPELVEPPRDSNYRRTPSMPHSNSSPATIEIPRGMPPRSYTDLPREHRSSNSPPGMHRSATMPTVPGVSSSSRRKEAAAPRPSGLRETMTPEHSSPERNYASIPQPQNVKYYQYTPGGAGVSMRPEDVATGSHRTILREPERQRHHSPEPLSRPPIGVNRPSEANTSAKVSPSKGRSSRQPSPVRGRSERQLYGELGSDYTRARQASFSPHKVQYTKKFGPEDVRWAPRGHENEREFANKPTLGRTATYVY